MRQYLRKVRLTAKGSKGEVKINPGGLDGPQLKIEFDIIKDLSSEQNEAEIKIYNLSEKTRNALGTELDDVTLEAGYMPPGEKGNVGIIFKGQIRDVTHTRDGADIVTVLTNGEGDKAVRNATISKSYKAGTPVKEVAEDIQKELEKEGVSKGEWKFPDTIKDFKRPYVAVGGAKIEMDHLSRDNGFYWGIQNGVTEVIPADGFIGGIVNITPRSGLVGIPAITDNGVKVGVLLNPEIRVGRRVKIESDVLEMNAEGGVYRVSALRYSGDNRDGDMIVFIEGESIKGDKVDEGQKMDGPANISPAQPASGLKNTAQEQATSGTRGDN